MSQAARDNNRVPTLIGVSSIDLTTPTRIAANPTTGAVVIDPTNLDSRYVNHDATGGGTEELDFIDFDINYSDGSQEGRLQWNTDAGFLEVGMPGGTVNLQIGEEQLIRVRNQTGSTITNGSLVYITGESGNKPLVALAQADVEATSEAIAMATEDIGHNSNGYCTVLGKVNELDTSGYVEGDELFLSADTAGAFTNIAPTGSNYLVHVGHVIAVHATQGSIWVDIAHTGYIDGRYVNVTGDSMTGLLDISLETADTTTTDEVLTLGRTSTGSALGNFGSELVFKNQITEVGSIYPSSLSSGLRGTRINAGAIKTYWNSNTVLTRADGVLALSAYYNATNEREVVQISANSTAATINIGTGTISTGIYNINIGRGTISSPTGSILISGASGGSITADSSVFVLGSGVGSITGSSSAGLVGGYGYATGTYNTVVGSWVRADGSSHSHTFGSGNASGTTYLDNNTANSILMGANGNEFMHLKTDYSDFKQVSTTHVPFRVIANASPNANLFEIASSSETPQLYFDKSFNFYLGPQRADMRLVMGDTQFGASGQMSFAGGFSVQNDQYRSVTIANTNNKGTSSNLAGLNFGGYYTTGGTAISTYAGVVGGKENNTSGDYAGRLYFVTRKNGGNPLKQWEISSEGTLTSQGQNDAIQLVVKGNVGQTANLTEWQNSGGTALTVIDKLGHIGIRATPTTNVALTVNNVAQTVDTLRFQLNGTTYTQMTRFGGWLFGTQASNEGFHVRANQVPTIITSTLGFNFAFAAEGYGSGNNSTFFAKHGSTTVTSRAFQAEVASEQVFAITGGKRLIVGTGEPSARLHIKGRADEIQAIIQANSTQTANLTEWQNSSGTALGYFSPGGSGYFSGKLGVGVDPSGANYGINVAADPVVSGDASVVGVFTDTRTAAGGVGGGLGFIGYRTGTSLQAIFSAISGTKENNTSGDYAGQLNFMTRQNGGDLLSQYVLSSEGTLTSQGQNDAIQLVVKGNASQTANLTEWQSSSGTVLTKINELGYTSINTSNDGAPLNLGANTGKDAIYIYGTTGVLTFIMGTDGSNNGTFRLRNSSGTDIINLNGSGSSFINAKLLVGNLTFSGDAQLYVESQTTSRIGQVIRGAPGQTANLFETQNSSGSDLTVIQSNGTLYVNSSGIAGVDFRVASLFYIDTTNSRIGFGTTSPTTLMDIRGTESGGNIVFNHRNEGSANNSGIQLAYTINGSTSARATINKPVGANTGATYQLETRNDSATFKTAFTASKEGRMTYGNAQAYPIETITASSDTLDDTNHVVLCDATSNAITINLPAISGNEGLIYHIKKIDSSANAVTIDGSGSETIDGDTTKVLSSQYDSAMIVCGSSEWSII